MVCGRLLYVVERSSHQYGSENDDKLRAQHESACMMMTTRCGRALVRWVGGAELPERLHLMGAGSRGRRGFQRVCDELAVACGDDHRRMSAVLVGCEQKLKWLGSYKAKWDLQKKRR